MKRIIALAFILCLLTSCSFGKKAEANDDSNHIIVVYPDSEKRETVNGYKLTDIVYIANGKTKKFHLSECQYAKSIDENYRIEEKDREKLINDGFVPCKACNP